MVRGRAEPFSGAGVGVVIGFELGSRRPLLVRREVVAPRVSSGSGERPWRLLYASDLHLTARRDHLVTRLEEAVAGAAPHVVLLGGDLVDGASGIEALGELVTRLRAIAPVFAVGGNHDGWVGVREVRRAVDLAGGHWLARPVTLPAHGDRPGLLLCGEEGAAGSAGPGSGNDDARIRRVLVGHHPTVAERSARMPGASFDLVLAGHLHGGQCVLWQRGSRFYPGAWFSRWTGSRFDLPNTTLVVSRGVADTLPIRFRCPREVLLVELR